MLSFLWRCFCGAVTLLPATFIVSILGGIMFAPMPLLGDIVYKSLGYVIAGVFAMTSYYLYITVTDERLTESRKTMWVILLLLWFPVAGPVFWYRRVWRTADATKAHRLPTG
jgi:hypothetical protein